MTRIDSIPKLGRATMPRAILYSLFGFVLAVNGFAESQRPIGKNLLPAGDMEAVARDGSLAGWTVQVRKRDPAIEPVAKVSQDGQVFRAGKASAKLALETAGVVQLTSEPMSVTAGQKLFVRFLFRVTGLSKSKSYEGGQAFLRIDWFDAEDRAKGMAYIGNSYIPIEWVYRDQIIMVPKGVAACRAVIEMNANATTPLPAAAWFDDVAICPYTPEPFAQKTRKRWSVSDGRNIYEAGHRRSWVYLAGRDGRETAHGSRVEDADTITGHALHSPTGVERGYLWHSAYTVEQPSGLYRAVFRMKIPAKSELADDDKLVSVDVTSSDAGVRMTYDVRRQDFQAVDSYQELAFDFVKRTGGWITLRVYTPGGKSELWLDHASVCELQPFSDTELANWYPGIAPPIDPSLKVKRLYNPPVLLVQGLSVKRYQIANALRHMGRSEVTRVTYRRAQAGGLIDGFPKDWAALHSTSVILLANVGVDGIAPEQRFLIRQFVSAGGGLVILGGKVAYGAAGLTHSFLDEMLPVEVAAQPFDIERLRRPLSPSNPEHGIVRGLDWGAKPHCDYLHAVTLRPNAEVLVDAGGDPFVATSTFGKGRVVCVLGAPYGDGGAGAFFDWSSWPELLRNMLLWAGSQDARL